MNDDAQSRTRTYSWDDPMTGAERGRYMSGIEYLKAIKAGELPPPPIANTLEIGISEIEEGRVVFTVVPEEYHYNLIGTVHGGLAATLLDLTLGCAIYSMLPAGTGYTTLELKINYIRAMNALTGKVYCKGKVIHVGGRVATAEGYVTDAQNKLYAHATTTCIILKRDVSN